ncbi:YhjD/YihY/BrkB family envelope integrity protein [Actinomycetospora sp. C-140]
MRRTIALIRRVGQRMTEISGYDRAVALAAHVFTAILPMLLVLDALLPRDARRPAGDALAASLGLSSSAASAVTAALPPSAGNVPGPSGGLTVVGALLLAAAIFGFARTLQRTHHAVWELGPGGVRDRAAAALAAVVLVAEFGLLAWLGPDLVRPGGSVVLGFVGHALFAAALWWVLQWLLLAGRVPWRSLLPGSVLTALAQTVVVTVSGSYLPFSITGQAARNGLAGVVIAFLSWQVVISVLIVTAAVVGAELAHHDRPRRPRVEGATQPRHL